MRGSARGGGGAVSTDATAARERARMTPFESALDWNRRCPPGTRVRVLLREGASFEAETAGYAQQWGAFALIALRGYPGVWTARVLRPLDPPP